MVMSGNFFGDDHTDPLFDYRFAVFAGRGPGKPRKKVASRAERERGRNEKKERLQRQVEKVVFSQYDSTDVRAEGQTYHFRLMRYRLDLPTRKGVAVRTLFAALDGLVKKEGRGERLANKEEVRLLLLRTGDAYSKTLMACPYNGSSHESSQFWRHAAPSGGGHGMWDVRLSTVAIPDKYCLVLVSIEPCKE